LDPVTVATLTALEEREERWTDEVLEAARERLEFGWTQGSLAETLSGVRQWTPDGDSAAFCVLGALKSAAAELRADVYTLWRAERLIVDAIGGDADTRWRRGVIASWNDQPGRSKAEVIAMIGRALSRPSGLARDGLDGTPVRRRVRGLLSLRPSRT
jgi:hypothetical protein